MQHLVKQLTLALGVVLTIVGIAGFFSGDMLVVFQVDTLHNVIHLLSGVVALAAVNAGTSYARMYLIIFGIVYGLVTILGFTMAGSILGLFSVNMADNYLHAVIAIACLWVGFRSKS